MIQRYEDAIVAQADSSDGSQYGAETACYGSDCFRYTHLFCAALCVVASLAGMLLGNRTGRMAADSGRNPP